MMIGDWVQDIEDMHTQFGVNDKIRTFDKEKLKQFLNFRVAFLEEELNELKDNLNNPEEIVDALIDLCVVAIGTLDAFEINAYQAWETVHNANMAKEVGIKASRPNPLGLPDLIKPEDWRAPSHKNNYGLLNKLVN